MKSKTAKSIFKSQKLAALAAYSTMFNDRGFPASVNNPRAFSIPWISGVDYLIALFHWQSVRHNDDGDGWGIEYTTRWLAAEIGVEQSVVVRALQRLERAGLIIRNRSVRVLWLHPYCIRLYLTWTRGGEQLPLPDVERERITAGLEASGAFLPVRRPPTVIPLNFELESRAYSLDELRRHCLSLVEGPGATLSKTCGELGIDVGSLLVTDAYTHQTRCVDASENRGLTAGEPASKLEIAM